MSADPVYDQLAHFAAGLVSEGVRELVVCPGSRSTPLTLALHAQPGLNTSVHLDERSAGFYALGLGRATGRPAVVVCTSGTAVANLLPAVVEAHHACVPLIACTADRPAELRGWGSPQTIDQVGIFANATRWAIEAPLPQDMLGRQAAMLASRAVEQSMGAAPGPVHLNWPLREPLEPVGVVPVVHAAPAGAGRPAMRSVEHPLVPYAPTRRGVIVVGPWDGHGLDAEHANAAGVLELAASTGWPVIAEPLTQLRRGSADGAVVVATADHLLTEPETAASLAPELVVRVGHTPTTKSVRSWMQHHHSADVVVIDPAGQWNDPSFTMTRRLDVSHADALRELPGGGGNSEWSRRWADADGAVAAAIDESLAGADTPMTSAAIARSLALSLPGGSTLMVSNSMPVRDVDQFWPAGGEAIDVVGNRGASGIDGITSTALGLAASRPDRSAALLSGDLAVLHDLAALGAAKRLGLHLSVVVVDNDGGDIFSMLPIAQRRDEIDFDTLFRTPHGLDLELLDGFGSVRSHPVRSATDLVDAVEASMGSATPGVDLMVVRVDPDDDREFRRAARAAAHRAARRVLVP